LEELASQGDVSGALEGGPAEEAAPRGKKQRRKVKANQENESTSQSSQARHLVNYPRACTKSRQM